MLESHLCPDLIITGGLHFPYVKTMKWGQQTKLYMIWYLKI